jgi:hypothetical protein
MRDPENTIYSKMKPKPDSYPLRPFENLGKPNTVERFKNITNQWMENTKGCLKLIESHKTISKMIFYENLPNEIEGLTKFLKLPLKLDDLNFKNRNLPKESIDLSKFWQTVPETLKYKKYIEKTYYS